MVPPQIDWMRVADDTKDENDYVHLKTKNRLEETNYIIKEM